MRTKFVLAATTAGLIVAMGGLANAEGSKASNSSAAPAASSGSTTAKSGGMAMTLQETKSDDAMAKSLNMRAKDLRDMDIYGADGKKIADVDHVLADRSNNIKAVSADVGGFLGMGTREVVFPIEKLSAGSQKDRLMTSLTKAEIQQLDQWTTTAQSGSTSGSSLSSNPSNTTGTTSTSSGAAPAPSAPAAGSSATAPRSSSGVAPNGR